MYPFAAFSQGKLNIPKDDFASLFSDTIMPSTLYINSAAGERLRAGYHKHASVYVEMRETKKKKILLHTVKVNNDSVHAIELTPFWERKIPTEFSLNDVETISIQKMFVTYAVPTFNLDSLNNICKAKMDSIDKDYKNQERYEIHLLDKNQQRQDTLKLLENACYHFLFKDGSEQAYGVIYKITKDSIYISDDFNYSTIVNKKTIDNLSGFSIEDIAGLRLMRGGGTVSKRIDFENFQVHFVRQNDSFCPCWYSFSQLSGEINFYRLILTAHGFRGIKKDNGRYYWFEG